MIKRILLMILVVFVFSPLFSAEKDRLAVMDVADEAKLFNKTTIANVTDYIFTKLQGTKIYWMVPKADRDTALEQAIEETVKGSRRECVDEKCQLSLVAQLQANFLINTKIKKLYKGACNISISKFDVEKRAGVDSWEAKFNCTEKGLYETIDGFDFGGKKEQVKIIKQDDTADKNACKYAKEKNDLEIWEKYIEKYPKGECEFEATVKIEELNKKKSEKDGSTKTSSGKIIPPPKEKELKKPTDLNVKTLSRWSKKSKNKMTWSEAIQYCENLKEDGYSDWRLPTISELRTLIKNCPTTETGGACKVTSDCLSSKYCINKACGGCSNASDGRYSKLSDTEKWFWSSSALSDDAKYAWLVGFYYGDVSSGSKGYKGNVRCVRTNLKTSAGTWSKNSTHRMDWVDAKAYCDNLKESGYSGWRMPTISELRTLVKECSATETGGSCGVNDSCLSESKCRNNNCNGCPSSDGKYSIFNDIGRFWSSSERKEDKRFVWFVNFFNGSVYSDTKTGSGFVRCVR